MIQRARVYPQFEYLPQKYHLDHFHNPYIARLNLKITPRTSTSNIRYNFINPLNNNNNLYLSHSLPLYKNQRFRFGLIWRQYITNKFARSHVGFTVEHKLLDDYKVKASILTGTTSIVNTQLTKIIHKNYEVFLGYSGFFQSSHVYNTFAVGVKKGLFSLMFTHKMGDETQFKMSGSKELYDGIKMGAGINGNVLEPERSELALTLYQPVDHKSTSSLAMSYNPFYRQISVKVDFQRHLTQSQKVLISTELSDKTNVIYLGFKNYNFNLVVPVFITESPIPFILGVLGFGLAYLYRKKFPISKKQLNIDSDLVEKNIEDRQEELRVISQKATDNYQKQKLSPKGLLIEEAYIGPKDELQNFMNNPERIRLLLRNQEYKNKFVDLTVSLRFYVCKNELKLRKGDKSKVLGFYCKDINHSKIGIRYIQGGQDKIKYYDVGDSIMIHRLE